jgi:hypothetical protein
MAVRVLTYDLNRGKTKEDCKAFCEIIEGYNYVRLSESSYALDTGEHPLIIYKKLEPYIDSDDKVFISTLTKPMYGKYSREVSDWLKEKDLV